ncbi:hypothetical protein Egran_04897 [Elaphomyces granulatus]|uniref:Uncharacterized protein n=1 Tax=Elaphomyces granulatus TaxID=519963 RepID=A0A232LTJ5_9EURO|nr:hypothetical protein Egran_04897 [Elaphomyces granulatus]
MFNSVSRRLWVSKLVRVPCHEQSARSFYHGIQENMRREYSQALFARKPVPYTRNQVRSLAFSQRMRLGLRKASKGIWRNNPILFPLAIISVVGATALLIYVTYVQVTYVNPQYNKFPPEVAKALRIAVYYTELDLNPSRALVAYQEALRIAMDQGIHPYSDEVLGIKLQVALMLEKAGLVKAAIEVLERTKKDALIWINEGRGMKEVTAKGRADNSNTTKIHDSVLEAQRQRKEQEDYEERQRDKTLKKVIGMEVKLAELYSSDHIQDEKRAEESQVAAVELCLKEMKRRQRLGLPVGQGSGGDDGSWLNLIEIASAFTDLADMYTQQQKPELALPLYMQALAMVKEDEGNSTSCKQVVLLNNVAQAMVEQANRPVHPSKGNPSTQLSLSNDQIIDDAKQWARKAVDVAADIHPPVRDESCDVSCVVATVNLGYLSEMQNRLKEADDLFLKAKRLAQDIGYQEGIAQAEKAQRRLEKSRESHK